MAKKRVDYGKLPMSGDEDKGLEALKARRLNIASVGKSDTLLHEPDEVHIYIEVPGIDLPVVVVLDEPQKVVTVMHDMAAAANRCWPKVAEKGDEDRPVTMLMV